MFPAVYIHNDGEWYEDYWLLGFTDEFDCWDNALHTANQNIRVNLKTGFSKSMFKKRIQK